MIALSASPAPGADTPPRELLGRWRSVETTKGGIGAILVFRAEGTLDLSLGAIVEMPYRIEGGEIIFPPATTDGPAQRTKLDFTGADQLKIGTDQLTRKGSATDPNIPILGEWEGKRDMGGQEVEVHYLFYRDAKCLLLIPFATTTSKYTIEGQNIRIERSNQPLESETFTLENGVLRVSDASQTRTYLRY
jgi:hypothetical protein